MFCLWVLLSTLMLGVDPEGTVQGSAVSRLLPSILVRADYFAATIALLYIGNLTEHELPQRLLQQLLALMFVWVVAGGILGLVFPTLEFASLLERVLRLASGDFVSNPFVRSLVHPASAQLQDVLGSTTPRPSAPWGYTNIWGNNFGVLIVWFVYVWDVRATGNKMILFGGAVVLAVSLVVATLSLNRGLWIGLLLALAYAMARLARNGHVGVVTSLVVMFVLSSSRCVHALRGAGDGAVRDRTQATARAASP
ncbi:MAG: hypothetical protein WKF82_03295 [Nocardioidaceae bacterium]